nr:hypothetical protein BaRGS_016711 [Batillaria attramentaria]
MLFSFAVQQAEETRLLLPPIMLPPIYTVKPTPLRFRDSMFSLAATPRTRCSVISDEEWEQLKDCRYIRHRPFKVPVSFYGVPWSADQRKILFSWMQEMSLNTYMYAPKDDYKHRAYWRELYSVEEADNLTTLIESAHEKGVTFVYAISPGLDISFSSAKDVQALKRKLAQVAAFGCQAFAILFDDIDPELSEADQSVFSSSACAQVSVTNEVYEHLGQPKFLFCPTGYLNTIGSKLLPGIDVMWTGCKVISKKISIQTLEDISTVLKRAPVIWDNIHANDYDPRRIFLGPYDGRSPEIIPYIRGVLTNPNCEFEANYIACHTLGQWCKSNPDGVKKDIIATPLTGLPEVPSALAVTPEIQNAVVNLATVAREWCQKAEEFEKKVQALDALLLRLFVGPNKSVLCDLYAYLWDMKGILAVCLAYIKWLAAVKRLLPICTAHDLFLIKSPDWVIQKLHTFRPYQIQDKSAVYDVCLKTCDDGMDGTEAFLEFPSLIGDRLAGNFLTLSSDHCFVVEDEEGVFGYALAAIDAKDLAAKSNETWLLDMQQKYPKPTNKQLKPAEVSSYPEQVCYGPDGKAATQPRFTHFTVSVANEVYEHLNQPKFLFCLQRFLFWGVTVKMELSSLSLWSLRCKVISKKITIKTLEDISAVLRRAPVIWDNIHANDYDPRRVFLGPYDGRSPEIIPYIRGVLTTPTVNLRANYIACHTLGQWCKSNKDGVKKDIIANERLSPVAADIRLETEDDFGAEEDPHSHGDLLYSPRQALKTAMGEWLEEFSDESLLPPDMPLGVPPIPFGLPPVPEGEPPVPPVSALAEDCLTTDLDALPEAEADVEAMDCVPSSSNAAPASTS